MVSPRPRPFFDTNVVFSGLGSSGGPPEILLDLHATERIGIVVSGLVMQELERNLRLKRPRVLLTLAAFFENTPFEIVAEPTEQEIAAVLPFINAADAPILAAAIKSEADCIVSGNTRHFTQAVAQQAGIPIFTPAAYLQQLQPL